MTQLDPLAKAIVRLSQQRGVTPVIVTPHSLTLRAIFFIELAKSLQQHAGRSIRIDWCRRVPSAWSLLGDQLARWQARRINRALHQAFKTCEHDVSLQITATVARPGGINRQLVVGWCSEDMELPPWTIPVHLAGSPASLVPADSAKRVA